MKQIGPIVGWRNYKKVYALCGRTGTLVTYTNVQNSYCLGMIKLDEGEQMLAQLTDVDFSDLYIGMPVRAVFRKLSQEGAAGIINYGIKFVPTKKAKATRTDRIPK